MQYNDTHKVLPGQGPFLVAGIKYSSVLELVSGDSKWI